MNAELSMGELQSLAAKAARGAGRGHGHAEEAGFAVRWLTERGLDGAGALAALLHETDGIAHGLLAPVDARLQAAGDAMCPLVLGSFLSDLAVLPERPTGPVHGPLLLVPFLAQVVTEWTGIDVDGQRLVIGPEPGAEIYGAALPVGPGSVTLVPGTAPGRRRPRQSRARIDDGDLAYLLSLADGTYAPATEESRARGAGAGLTDND